MPVALPDPPAPGLMTDLQPYVSSALLFPDASISAGLSTADIQDRDPFLMKLYADGGYQGPLFRRAVAKIMARLNVEIVKRSDHAKGFVVLPKRWVVERTFAWLGRCRRLAKDWENSTERHSHSAPRFNQAHAQKTMQSRMISPDRL